MAASRTLTFGSCSSVSSSADTTSLPGWSICAVQLTPRSRSVADCCCISDSVSICRMSRQFAPHFRDLVARDRAGCDCLVGSARHQHADDQERRGERQLHERLPRP